MEKITVYWSVLLCTVLSNETYCWNTHCCENILLWVCLFWYSGIYSVYVSFVHSLDLVCKISIYHSHSSVSIFVLWNYCSDLDNVWCVGLWRSYEVIGAVPMLALYAFMVWTGTTLSFFYYSLNNWCRSQSVELEMVCEPIPQIRKRVKQHCLPKDKFCYLLRYSYIAYYLSSKRVQGIDWLVTL